MASAWTPSERARVFDRFWRSENSCKTSRGGSGLGLAIVAATAEGARWASMGRIER